MLESIFSALAVSAAVTIFGFIGKAFSEWSAREKKKEDALTADVGRMDAIEALHMGVTTIGETVVKEMKAAAASDGKLSKDEIRKVQRLAIAEAVKIATNPTAIEFLVRKGFDTLSAIITGIVQGKKSRQTETES